MPGVRLPVSGSFVVRRPLMSDRPRAFNTTRNVKHVENSLMSFKQLLMAAACAATLVSGAAAAA